MRTKPLQLIIFVSALWLYSANASAGLLVQRPLYIGLDKGLVGYWSFDEADMAGQRAYDRSGNNNTGVLTNGPARAIGKLGQALKFGGSQTKNPAFLQDFEDSTLQGISRFATGSASIASQKSLSSAYVDILETLDLGGVAPPGPQWQTGVPLRSRPRAL